VFERTFDVDRARQVPYHRHAATGQGCRIVFVVVAWFVIVLHQNLSEVFRNLLVYLLFQSYGFWFLLDLMYDKSFVVSFNLDFELGKHLVVQDFLLNFVLIFHLIPLDSLKSLDSAYSQLLLILEHVPSKFAGQLLGVCHHPPFFKDFFVNVLYDFNFVFLFWKKFSLRGSINIDIDVQLFAHELFDFSIDSLLYDRHFLNDVSVIF